MFKRANLLTIFILFGLPLVFIAIAIIVINIELHT